MLAIGHGRLSFPYLVVTVPAVTVLVAVAGKLVEATLVVNVLPAESVVVTGTTTTIGVVAAAVA